MIEEKDYAVKLTVTLKSRIYFAPVERNSELTPEDAVDNAIGMLQKSTWENMHDNFIVNVKGEAEEI